MSPLEAIILMRFSFAVDVNKHYSEIVKLLNKCNYNYTKKEVEKEIKKMKSERKRRSEK